MIIFTGPPGSGKTTQVQLLAKYLGCPWLSVGKLLRENLTDPKERAILRKGELVDSAIVIRAMEAYFSQLDLTQNELVLDGPLRRIEEVKWIIGQARIGKIKLRAIINLVIPDNLIEKRLVKRRRSDDTPEVIKERLKIFHQTHDPIIKFLKNEWEAVMDVSAQGNETEVFERVKKALGLDEA